MPVAETFAELLALEPHGPDVFVGISAHYPWGRVYGGQVVAQGLWAAANTVDDGYGVHSVHAYFVRGGQPDEPIRFEVDRLRNGRSFQTRRVVARQSSGAILNLAASFHVEEQAVDIQSVVMPDEVPSPDQLTGELWNAMLDRRPIPDLGEACARMWLRIPEPLGDDPVVHACALSFTSDDIPMDAITSSHPVDVGDRNHNDVFMGASLDHTIWFHRPGRADQWQLHDVRSHGLTGARGLGIGNVFGADGTHLATIAQEGLLRLRR